MNTNLSLEIVPAHHLNPDLRMAIYELCNRAYRQDLEPLFSTFHNPTHVLAWLGTRLVSHALWVTRWLQAGDQPILHTAYVEMVATEPEFRRR
jgi:aminoglycoside 2'-N-acetyltransferase I